MDKHLQGRKLMHRMRDRADWLILAVTNAMAWMVNMEQALKVVLLVVSIGYALHRWWHWAHLSKRDRQRALRVE
jgi:hypothetical protein